MHQEIKEELEEEKKQNINQVFNTSNVRMGALGEPKKRIFKEFTGKKQVQEIPEEDEEVNKQQVQDNRKELNKRFSNIISERQSNPTAINSAFAKKVDFSSTTGSNQDLKRFQPHSSTLFDSTKSPFASNQTQTQKDLINNSEELIAPKQFEFKSYFQMKQFKIQQAFAKPESSFIDIQQLFESEEVQKMLQQSQEMMMHQNMIQNMRQQHKFNPQMPYLTNQYENPFALGTTCADGFNTIFSNPYELEQMQRKFKPPSSYRLQMEQICHEVQSQDLIYQDPNNFQSYAYDNGNGTFQVDNHEGGLEQTGDSMLNYQYYQEQQEQQNNYQQPYQNYQNINYQNEEDSNNFY
eukprot:403345070